MIAPRTGPARPSTPSRPDPLHSTHSPATRPRSSRRRAVCGATLTALLVLIAPEHAQGQFPDVEQEVGTNAGLRDELRIDSCSTDLGLNSSVHPCIVGTDSGPGGDDVHVVWQDYRDAESSIYYRRLQNYGTGGQVCEVRLSDVASTPQQHATDPRLLTDGSTELYVVYRAFLTEDVDGSLDRMERIMFVRSVDTGGTWSAPLQLGMADLVEAPQFCTDGLGRLYVVWSQNDGPYGLGNIYFTASDDSGASWTVPKRVNNDTSAHSQDATVACDAHGNVAIAYLDHRSLRPAPGPQPELPRAPFQDVFLQQSDDPAVLFGPNPFDDAVQLSQRASAADLRLVAYSAGPGPVPLQRLVLAAWHNLDPLDRQGAHPGTLGPGTRLESNLSINGAPFSKQPIPVVGGTTAAAPIGPAAGSATGTTPTVQSSSQLTSQVVTQAEQSVSAPPAIVLQTDGPAFYGLDLTVSSTGRVHAVYGRIDSPVKNSNQFPLLNSPQYVFHNVFNLNTEAWGGEQRISTAGSPFSAQGRPLFPEPSIAVDNADNVFVAWIQSSIELGTHDTYADINAAWSSNGGASWSPASGLTSKADGPGSSGSYHPRVFARDGVAAVVWDDRRAHTRHDVPGGLLPGDPLGAPDLYLNVITLP